MAKLISKTLFIAALLLVFALSAHALADKPAPRGIALSMTETAVDLAEGNTFELTAEVNPEGASRNFKWWVSDTSVLSVEDGLVTCLKPGEANVYVSVHGYSDVRANCLVKVSDSRAPERIIVYPSSISLEPGMGTELQCVVMPQSAGAEFTFTSSNLNVAVVNEDGYLSVLNPGHATITVRSLYSPDIKSEIKLNSEYGERIRSISLADTSLRLEKGEIYYIDALLEPENASKALIYTVGDESVATVDYSGLITALSYGFTDITVSSYRDPGVSASLPISVSDSDRPESLTVNLSGETNLHPGQTVNLGILLEPASAVTSYTATSSREDIVSVNGDTLTAIKRGISRVRVQSDYREDLYCEFTVTVEDGFNTLVMPLRRTDEAGIEANLKAIDAVKQSALNELKVLYDGGLIEKKEYDRRVNTVERAFDMYAFPWTVDETVKYWKSENSENGAKDFKPGTIYYGLPYTSGENHNRAYDVGRALDQGRYVSVEDKNYYLMNRDSDDYAMGYAGNDCSAFVAQALWGYTVHGEIVKTGTLYYDNRLRAFDDPGQLKAGDLLVRHSSHVVMFLYWADEAHTQAVFIQQGGNEPGINTVNAVVEELSYYTENSYRLRRLYEY